LAQSFSTFVEDISPKPKEVEIQVAVLTKVKSKKPELVSNMIAAVCKDRGIECHVINVREAWVSQNDLEKGTLTISNVDGEDTEVEFDISRTVCFVRAGVLEDEIGLALLGTFENAGAFMVNNRDGMMTCDNKMSSYIAFERDNIPVPRTSLVSNEKSIEHAHEKIGGKFPVIIKTITGTQGIGVSIVNDYQSMVSVIQSLWKFKAELLIQEYLKFDYDIRTVVMNGKILASTKRIRPEKDFRSNRHRGATTEPHELSERERESVLSAARSVGAYIVGVDHAIVGDDIYILECNGSAGVGSDFGIYDITMDESDENDYKGQAKPKQIIDKMMEYISIANNRRHSFPTEAGYVEQIDIEGYGPVRAKFDTGNGTKASMFVVDELEVKGKNVKWSKNGKGTTSKLMGMSHPAHVGKIDERPIVHLDVRFNNKLYKDVPFGLTTKDSMSTVLINRDAMTRFKVSVNPNRRFVLSDWIERGDANDDEG
jgi:RimK family alpha-L-glutamate ligase